MYKPELKSVRNLFWKNKDVCLYVKQFARLLVKKKILSLVYLKNLRLKSSQLSLKRILNFSFSILDQVHLEWAPCICLILRACTSSSTEVLTADATDLADDVTLNIRDEIVLYQENLDQFPLLNERQNSQRNCSLIMIVALWLSHYICCVTHEAKSRISSNLSLDTPPLHIIFPNEQLKRSIKLAYRSRIRISVAPLHQTQAW